MRINLTMTILLSVVIQAFAIPGHAQNVSIQKKNATLAEIFTTIRQQTGYDFIVDGELLRKAVPVHVDFKNVSLTEALETTLKGQSLTYTIHDRTVVVKELPRASDRSKVTIKLQHNISGRITNVEGQPVAGVSVTLKGTSRSVQSDESGNYTMEIPTDGAVLVFSHLGYEQQELAVGNRNEINIVLQSMERVVEETVVVAYGAQQRKNITGSVVTVSSEQLQDLPPVVNVEEALKGLAAGVMVQQETGQPGAATRVRIRGASSLLGSNQPLYVVDGIPMVSESNIPSDGSTQNTAMLNQGLNSPLNNLNPLDIESISVLKDASATAMYGSRAANGVVIITTKSGVAGQPSYNFMSSLAVQEAQTMNVLNADQFREIWTEIANNTTSTVPHLQQIRNGTYFGDADTDWAKEVSVSSPLTRQANLSLSGGSQAIRYFSSIGYMGHAGTFKNTGFDRYTFLTKFDLDASKYVKLGAVVNLSSSDQLATHPTLLANVYQFRPDILPYNEDGSYTHSPFMARENPLAMSQVSDNNKTLLMQGTVYGEVNFARYFKLRSALSASHNNGRQRSFYPSFTALGGFNINTGLGPGYAQEGDNKLISRLWENTLNYRQNIEGKHDIDAVLGLSFQSDETGFLKASGRGFPQDEVLTNLSSATQDFLIRSERAQSGLLSYFSRVNYALHDRYLFTLAARWDTSSKFGQGNQRAFFPTAAIGWRLSEEPFMQSLTFLDELKIRGSVGVTGQQSFGPYAWRTLFEASHWDGAPAVSQIQLGNANLQWELATQTDVGLDFSLFRNRLNGSFEYYRKLTNELHYHMLTPPSSGFVQTISNLGTTLNQGVELTLEGQIMRTDNFSWEMMVNVSRNRNKLVSLNDDYVNSTTGMITPPSGGGVLRVGDPIGLIYGYVAEGIIQTQEQLDQLNALATDGIYQSANTDLGDLWFRDISGPDGEPDGKITALDQTVIGNAMPDMWGGFSSTFRYKGIRLMAHFNYTVGNDIRWGTQSTEINFPAASVSENKWDIVMNRWTPENPTDQPRIAYGDPNNNARISSYYVHDGSFLRLNNVLLEYSLPKGVLDRTRVLSNAQLFGSARNLLTFTKYPGPNPETSNLFNNDVSAGLDNSRFPVAKTFTLGIRAAF